MTSIGDDIQRPRRIPAGPARAEIRVVNSRFIASLSPACSVEEARGFIDSMRQEFHDATHNVPVYVIGHGASVTAHCSDDGEPSGTAGRPALAVLRGSGLGDAAAVISRYFGGTKLGTGGLVRAYSDAMRAVLDSTSIAQKIPTYTVHFAVPYNLFEQAQLLVSNHRGELVNKTFAGDVSLTIRLPQTLLEDFTHALKELTRGLARPEVIESHEDTILPLSP